jgi:hypothetical protein
MSGSNAIDRRVSIAPKMDWTDDVYIVRGFNNLASLERASLLPRLLGAAFLEHVAE